MTIAHSEDKPTTHLRRWAIEQLANIGGDDVIDFLCVHGFFNIVKDSKKQSIAAVRMISEVVRQL